MVPFKFKKWRWHMECNCKKEGEIAAIHIRIEEHDRRLDKYENKQDTIYKMAESLAVMAEKMTGISEDVSEVKNDVTGLKKEFDNLKDQTKVEQINTLKANLGVWEKYKVQIITLIITAVVTTYLIKIGGM